MRTILKRLCLLPVVLVAGVTSPIRVWTHRIGAAWTARHRRRFDVLRPLDSRAPAAAHQFPEVCREPPDEELLGEGRAPPRRACRRARRFQVIYPDSYVMVDAGMDLQVHKFFGRGVEEPYDAAAAAQVERAVSGAGSSS